MHKRLGDEVRASLGVELLHCSVSSTGVLEVDPLELRAAVEQKGARSVDAAEPAEEINKSCSSISTPSA